MPAAAPVAAARTYLVFFDWNKADLTDRARQIIGEAASARGTGVTRIEVNGYTDRSGSNQYNQGLSTRRANAVAAELVRRGVPRYSSALSDMVAQTRAATVMGLLEEARLARLRGHKVAQKTGSVHSAFGRVKDWFMGTF